MEDALLSKGRRKNLVVGSNPIPGTNVAPSVMVAHLSVKQVERVRFPGSTQIDNKTHLGYNIILKEMK